MTLQKWAAWCGIALISAAAHVSAQQKFPERAGEWELSMPNPVAGQAPMTLLFCLSDEMWTKALTQNPSCTISNLSVTASGASYTLDCNKPTYTMKAKVQLDFDGTQHMVGKSALEMTRNGKTTNSNSQSDWRWKASTCTANDANMKQKAP